MQHPSSSGSHPTRRDFLVSTGALAAGLTLASAPVAQGAVEKLALNGGPKAVTAPIDEACKWPRYGKTEEKAVLDLLYKQGPHALSFFDQPKS